MVRQMERLAEAKPDPLGMPDAILLRPTVMVVFDSVRDEIFVVTPLRPQSQIAFGAAHERAIERLKTVIATLEGPPALGPFPSNGPLVSPPLSNTPKTRFFEMVEKAKEYIRAGDIFQAVLSQRFAADFALPAFSLYRALRRINP